MQVLKRFKLLKGSSFVESVIAIVIISTSLLVAFLIYLNVVRQNRTIAYYNAKHEVELLTQTAIEEKNYDDNTYKYDNYSINKEVELRNEEHTAQLKWTITTKSKTHVIKKIVPYYND